MNIRLARVETDLPAIASILNDYEPKPVNTDQVRSWFEYNPSERIHRRLVAVNENGDVTGYCCLVHEPSAPAGQFYVWIGVKPDHRCHGIGSALWKVSSAFLQEQGATRLVSEILDYDPPSLHFAQQRGFTIDRHLFHSFLDLSAFDETPYLPGLAALEADGIRFGSLADFPDTPETRHMLYDLNVTNVYDVPGVTNPPWNFTGFEQFIFGAPWFRREGQLLALDGDTWVGLAAVSLNTEAGSAYNEHTGVLRAYRGRKIAQGLKVLAVRYARAHGALKLLTDNDSLNEPILAINQKMGYQPQPGRYSLVSSLQ